MITVGPPPQTGDWCVPDRSYGPGGDVDTLDTRLIDNEPDNPLNQLRDAHGNRMIKQGVLVLATPVGNPDDAARLGHDFLVESKALSSAGQATITGCVTDSRTGMLAALPPGPRGRRHRVRRRGQHVSPRRIQHVDLDDASRVATLSLDAPPDTLQRAAGAARRDDPPAGPQLAPDCAPLRTGPGDTVSGPGDTCPLTLL